MPRKPTLLKKMAAAAQVGSVGSSSRAPARFVDDRGAEGIELLAEAPPALGQRSSAKIEAAADDDPRRLPSRMRIDNPNLPYGGFAHPDSPRH
jgi:hypothetical protein